MNDFLSIKLHGLPLTDSLQVSSYIVDRNRRSENVFTEPVDCHGFRTGQVLHHINLGDYVAKTVPSLKDLQQEISGGSDLGALSLLRTAMQILQRWVPYSSSYLSISDVRAVVIMSKEFFFGIFNLC